MVKNFLKILARFFSVKKKRRLVFLGVLGLAALTEFIASGLVRRTFVFYSIGDGMLTVEDRMLKRSSSREVNITRYVEEALLGPILPDLAPLFPRETRLNSLMFRDGVVYADLSESAALPPLEGGEVFRNFLTLYKGVRRNFPFVKDIRLFIAGRTVFFDKFRRIYIAENEK
ncbi:MAG: GerMN domain-containing protein [Treponema sp.]|jgi:hypothetical protein|nr:GerMN domain-containing protein [Treponema sp.]